MCARARFFGESVALLVDFGESGLLENEPTAPAEDFFAFRKYADAVALCVVLVWLVASLPMLGTIY